MKAVLLLIFIMYPFITPFNYNKNQSTNKHLITSFFFFFFFKKKKTMVTPGFVWFFLKRMPKFFALLFNIISFVLLIFILTSCSNTSQNSIFFANYKFNENSALYPIITNNFAKQYNMQNLNQISVKPGLSGICLDNLPKTHFNDSTQCYKKNYNFTSVLPNNIGTTGTNFTYGLHDILNIEILTIRSTNTSSSTLSADLNILEIAQDQTKLVHPSMTIVSLTFQVICMAVLLFTMIPALIKIPNTKSPLTLYLTIGVTFLSCCVNGFNGMLIQTNIDTVALLVPKSSMHILQVTKGTKLISMVWASFAMHIMQLFLLGYAAYRLVSKLDDDSDDNTFASKYDKEMEEDKEALKLFSEKLQREKFGSHRKDPNNKITSPSRNSSFASSWNSSRKNNAKHDKSNKNHYLYTYHPNDSSSTYI